MNTPIETERKFLIKMPNMSELGKMHRLRIMHMVQTYLLTDEGTNSRVRKIKENGKTSYIKTVKERISTLSCYENEWEIDEIQYKSELKNSDPNKSTIIKTRYAFPYNEHIIEIDIYPFWTDRAILEVELDDENEEISLPCFINVVKEVSEDKRYKNTNIAKSIPPDDI